MAMKSTTRLLCLLVAACVMTLFVIIGYALSVDCFLEARRRNVGDSSVGEEYDVAELEFGVVESRAKEISALKAELLFLQREVRRKRRLLLAANSSDYCQRLHEEKLIQSEVPRATSYESEADFVPFVRFTAAKLYPVVQGLGRRVVEKPIGAKREEIAEVIDVAAEFLNANMSSHETHPYDASTFLEGIYRTQDTIGTHYELYFHGTEEKSERLVKRVTLFRPFGELTIAAVREHNVFQTINVVVPLSGRLDSFAKFLNSYADKCLKHDKNVHLTVVYAGDEGLEEAQQLLQSFAVRHNYRQFSLEHLGERNFSRGAALEAGVRAWRLSGDVLLFLCDVDVVFNADFLRRCRVNAEAGARVYYPIVFSLYNPTVVYTMHGRDMPPPGQQLVVSPDAGFWRDFGYGMTCQYRSDFMRIGGFADRDIEGWGIEDVLLYRKYVRSSSVAVVRATDPDIFHVWHEKMCDPKLSDEQYRGCIRSKALTEASHQQLGLLAFKGEIEMRSRRRRFGTHL